MIHLHPLLFPTDSPIERDRTRPTVTRVGTARASYTGQWFLCSATGQLCPWEDSEWRMTDGDRKSVV